MKYLALIYGEEGAWEALDEDERKRVNERYRAFSSAADERLSPARR